MFFFINLLQKKGHLHFCSFDQYYFFITVKTYLIAHLVFGYNEALHNMEYKKHIKWLRIEYSFKHIAHLSIGAWFCIRQNCNSRGPEYGYTIFKKIVISIALFACPKLLPAQKYY
jgi:hypothetical protein